jgi:hypothetical protein
MLLPEQRERFAALHDAVVLRWTLDTSDDAEWSLTITARVHPDPFFGGAAPAGLESWPGAIVRILFSGVVGLATRAEDRLMSGEDVWIYGFFEATEFGACDVAPRLRAKAWHGKPIHGLLSLSSPPVGIEVMFADVGFEVDATAA